MKRVRLAAVVAALLAMTAPAPADLTNYDCRNALIQTDVCPWHGATCQGDTWSRDCTCKIKCWLEGPGPGQMTLNGAAICGPPGEDCEADP